MNMPSTEYNESLEIIIDTENKNVSIYLYEVVVRKLF